MLAGNGSTISKLLSIVARVRVDGGKEMPIESAMAVCKSSASCAANSPASTGTNVLPTLLRVGVLVPVDSVSLPSSSTIEAAAFGTGEDDGFFVVEGFAGLGFADAVLLLLFFGGEAVAFVGVGGDFNIFFFSAGLAFSVRETETLAGDVDVDVDVVVDVDGGVGGGFFGGAFCVGLVPPNRARRCSRNSWGVSGFAPAPAPPPPSLFPSLSPRGGVSPDGNSGLSLLITNLLTVKSADNNYYVMKE